MANYIVTTPSQEYNGKVYGVQFDHGRAIVSDALLDKSLGRTAKETVWLMHEDFGYEVTELDADEAKVIMKMLPHQMAQAAPKGEGKYKV